MTPFNRLDRVAAQPWLPANAFTAGIAERALRPAVARWAAAWFAGKIKADLAQLQPGDGAGQGWRVATIGVGTAASSAQRLRLAGLVLGETVAGRPLLDSDRRLLDGVARQCVDALGAEVVKTAGGGDTTDWRAGDPDELGDVWNAVVSADGDPIVRLALGRDLLVQLIRQVVGPGATVRRPRSFDSALEDQEVAVSAFIGRCAVSFGDLATLEIGDVICLDGRTGGPVPLAIGNRPSAVSGIIEQDGDELRLRLVE